jgi:hypothetical protein
MVHYNPHITWGAVRENISQLKNMTLNDILMSFKNAWWSFMLKIIVALLPFMLFNAFKLMDEVNEFTRISNSSLKY